jgi:rod shape-determining protein MreD
MIMRPGQQLLLPAQPLFIWGTLMGALSLNMLLNIGLWGRAAWVPDVLALVVVFWIVHQPHRVGMGSAFLFGVLLDVHQGTILGQHALAYTAMGFLAIALQRRLPWFTVPSQALQILPLFLLAHVLELSVRLAAGGTFPGLAVLLAPLLEALLWPLVSVLLLLPQRRAPDPDAHRPL